MARSANTSFPFSPNLSSRTRREKERIKSNQLSLISIPYHIPSSTLSCAASSLSLSFSTTTFRSDHYQRRSPPPPPLTTTASVAPPITPLNPTPPTLTPTPTASNPEPRATYSHSPSNHRHHKCTKPNTTTQTTSCRSHGTCALASPRISPRPHSRSAPDLPETTNK
ncbi:hypothetical protein GYH30_039570 [Glycine max]|nr:hypothetical protein GYH30_039570 [Glycine max]